MTTKPLPREAMQYLRRLRAGLAPLPESDREEIVQETASHLTDRLATATVAAACADLGAPEDYAAQFVTNYRISAALASGSPLAPVAQVLRMIGSGLRAFAVGFLLMILWCFAGGFAVVALLKPILPQHTGLFVGGGTLSLGVSDLAARAGTREVLGWWVIPVAIVAAVACALAARAVARRFLRAQRHHERPF